MKLKILSIVSKLHEVYSFEHKKIALSAADDQDI